MASFEDVIQVLIDTNQKLIDGKIDIKTAQHISQSTQVLINAARLQLDIFKATKDSQPFIENKPKGIVKHDIPIDEEDVVDCYDSTRNLV